MSSTEILGLLSHLTEAGFMRPVGAPASAAESSRSLQLRVGVASCRTEPAADPRVLDGIFAALRRCALDQRWQLYRNSETDPDPVAFWRREQTWLDGHPDERERHAHLKDLILDALPKLNGGRFELAVQHLVALPRLGELLSTEDGESLIQAARSRAVLDSVAFQVMELALLVPSDEIWRQVLDVAEQRYDRGGRQAMARIFAILGPDRLLISLRQGSKVVRILVMDELAQLRDTRAVPDLLELVEHKDRDLQRSAVFCLGKLQAVGARKPLLGLLETSGQQMDPYLRRTVWVALARIGGPEVLPVLESAAMYTDPADRRAVITALGELDHPSAARELARMYAMWGNNAYGQLAMQNLRRKGDLVASPILEELMLKSNQQIRRQIVLLLGEFQHPAAFPELLNMLTEEPRHMQEIALIAGITGQDVTERNDRIEYLRAWYRANIGLPQSVWFLNALGDYQVPHTLDIEQLRGDGNLSGVPELARLLIDAPAPQLRSLAARILRVVTHQDYGVVSLQAPEERRRAIAERYLYLVDAAQESKKR
ncbi:MAG: HEAT repeat domain-containing protein [Planctomycetota bacterium]